MTPAAPIFPSLWRTSRLVVQDSRLDEVDSLQAVFNTCSYVQPWDPTFASASREEIADLVSDGMAGAASTGHGFRMQTARLQDRQEIIGYYHLTLGQPQPSLVWISMFVTHPDFQRQHLGEELIHGLEENIRQLGAYAAIWIRVCLKNWPALRFWIRAGFTAIMEYQGDRVFRKDAHASLVLSKAVVT